MIFSDIKTCFSMQKKNHISEHNTFRQIDKSLRNTIMVEARNEKRQISPISRVWSLKKLGCKNLILNEFDDKTRNFRFLTFLPIWISFSFIFKICLFLIFSTFVFFSFSLSPSSSHTRRRIHIYNIIHYIYRKISCISLPMYILYVYSPYTWKNIYSKNVYHTPIIID